MPSHHTIGLAPTNGEERNVHWVKGEVKAKIKISPVVVFGVLSRIVFVRES